MTKNRAVAGPIFFFRTDYASAFNEVFSRIERQKSELYDEKCYHISRIAMFALILKKYSMRVVRDDVSWPVKAEWPCEKTSERRKKRKGGRSHMANAL